MVKKVKKSRCGIMFVVINMSKFVDAIIGQVIGDTIISPIHYYMDKLSKKFSKRQYEIESPKKFGQPEGSWSGDISMEIGTIESFIEKHQFDYEDLMYKWSTECIPKGKYNASEYTYDFDTTSLVALGIHSSGKKPIECGIKDEISNGNGALMRMLPVALYSYSLKLSDDEIVKLTNDICSLTHGDNTSKLGCYIYVRFVIALLQGKTKEEAYDFIQKLDYSMYAKYVIKKYSRILKRNIKDYSMDKISYKGATVYTLECALWGLMNAENYNEVLYLSSGIEDNTKQAAVAGSMAGIIYGIIGIPEYMLDKLLRKDYLIDLALRFEREISTLEKDVILGTIIGDIAGSRFEIRNCRSGKDFVLLDNFNGRFTDDTVMTLATAEALLRCNNDYSNLEEIAINTYVEIGRCYPKCGFGRGFYNWLQSDDHKPYGSFGNGAAMRISPVGALIKDKAKIKEIADVFTNISHNHEDSIKGAEAVSIAVNMALNGKSKEEIKKEIESNYFNIDDSREELMSRKEFHVNCVETVKQAMIAFLDSYDFEDAIRNAIAMGGDSDTIGAITGSIAAAYYGIPEDLCKRAISFLDDYLIDIHDRFIEKVGI